MRGNKQCHPAQTYVTSKPKNITTLLEFNKLYQ